MTMALSALAFSMPYTYANELNTQDIQIEENEEQVIEQDDEVDFEIPTDEEQLVDSSGKVILTLDTKFALVDGEEIELAAPPTVINDTTLLPLRFIGDQVVGALTEWDATTKTVTITKEDTRVVVTIGSKIATVDGMALELIAAPEIINDTTLLPLRFISEAFNIPIEYDSETKTITLTKEQLGEEIVPPPPSNEKPIASFYFPETYIAGQTVSAIDTSIDPDGDMIIDKLWSVTSTTTVTNKELSNMFKTPRAGTYTIGLQVKDEKGAWSDWTYQVITINPNRVPVITDLKPSQSSYAQGEKLAFSYTYDNETWETVKEGRWTYRAAHQDLARATVGKPEVLFTEGEYIITLQLDDAYGNRSQMVETRVTITDEEQMSELTYRFTQSKIGDWIDNFQNKNYLDYTPVNIDHIDYDAGTLIVSDSPEVVGGAGILYRDSIEGEGRLLIHHINAIYDPIEAHRLAVIVENPTSQPVTVTLKNKVIKGPSTDILRVGQLALKEYLEGTAPESIVLNPGERRFIYDREWTKDTCISGHVDVQTTGPVKFIVADLAASHRLEDIDHLTYFPSDGTHPGGTYDKLGIHYHITLKGGMAPERLTLGVANSGEWVMGYDERTMSPIENVGNYGITYYVTITATEDTGIILNNRGGIFQGAIKWEDDKVYNMPGYGSFNGTTTKAVVMGTIKKGETRTFEYLLPNGSATPTLIGFIPATLW